MSSTSFEKNRYVLPTPYSYTYSIYMLMESRMWTQVYIDSVPYSIRMPLIWYAHLSLSLSQTDMRISHPSISPKQIETAKHTSHAYTSHTFILKYT